MSTNLVDVHGLAKAFECSARQIQFLVLQGMPKVGHGKYNLRVCREWFEQRQSYKRRPWGSVSKQIAWERANRAILRAVRRELRAWPFRVAPQLVGKRETEILHILRGAVYDLSAALFTRPTKEKTQNG